VKNLEVVEIFALFLGCDFFERRVEKRIDVGTLLAFLFFLFQMSSYVLILFFVCVFLALVHLQVWVCAYGRIDIFSHVIILPSAASSVV